MREWQFCVTVPVRGQIRTYESVTVRKGQFGKKRKNILSKNMTNDFESLFQGLETGKNPEALIGQPIRGQDSGE